MLLLTPKIIDWSYPHTVFLDTTSYLNTKDTLCCVGLHYNYAIWERFKIYQAVQNQLEDIGFKTRVKRLRRKLRDNFFNQMVIGIYSELPEKAVDTSTITTFISQ